MTLEHTLSDLTQRLEDWQTRGINEAQTAQAIVLRILQALGYDIWNPFEVLPEASNNSGYRPDYTIQLDGDVRFIIEVKHLGKNLADTDKDMNQAVSYVSIKGKRWAILTNGQEWLFVDNDIRGEPSQKHALTINFRRHAKHAAGYLERLLGKAHWHKHDAEDALEPIIKEIRKDIQKRLQLGKIADKLADKLGKGFSRDKLGIEMAVQYVLDANERQLAEDNLEHLVKRLLGDEETKIGDQEEPQTPEPEITPASPPDSVERAIIEGIIRSRKYRSGRDGDVQAWLGDELLAATTWSDLHAGLAEALFSLGHVDVLEQITQIYESDTAKRKGDGTPYPSYSYRQFSDGRFIYLHGSAPIQRSKIKKFLNHLNVTPQHLKVTYRGETYYLP